MKMEIPNDSEKGAVQNLFELDSLQRFVLTFA